MKRIFSRLPYFRSITVLWGAVMLLSCGNDIRQIKEIVGEELKPAMTGKNLEMTYSDSARIKYRVITPEYLKITRGEEKYEEFPRGIYVVSYDRDGKEMGSIRSKYARKLEDDLLWEARNEVVIINAEGKKLETEQLFWDMKQETIYSKRYVRLTSEGQIIEGNNGFKSDQNLNDPVFYGITGQVEVEK